MYGNFKIQHTYNVVDVPITICTMELIYTVLQYKTLVI